MTFRISADAVKYIEKYVFGIDAPEELVLVIVPAATIESTKTRSKGSSAVTEDIAQVARDLLNQHPPLRWEVGGVRVERVPEKDCRVVNGVRIYFPVEMEELLFNHVLKLEKGVLKFDPDLGPIEDMRGGSGSA